jgi:hypothetical protein
MSYILDALRRLEQDKERAKRGANPMEAVLAPDMEGAEEPDRRRFWWVGIGVVLLVTVIAGTYWIARRTVVARTESTGEETVPHLSSAPHGYDRYAPTPSPEAASTSFQPLRSDRERTPTHSAPSASSSRGAPPSSSSLGKPAAVADPSPPIRVQEGSQSAVFGGEDALPSRQERMSISPEVSEDEVFQAWTGSEIKINAIAYSRDDKSRFAVVNLKTVHEGDSLEGLAVVAIQENGIVFERDGTKYKVMLGKR